MIYKYQLLSKYYHAVIEQPALYKDNIGYYWGDIISVIDELIAEGFFILHAKRSGKQNSPIMIGVKNKISLEEIRIFLALIDE